MSLLSARIINVYSMDIAADADGERHCHDSERQGGEGDLGAHELLDDRKRVLFDDKIN
jgi:hypothetical protein